MSDLQAKLKELRDGIIRGMYHPDDIEEITKKLLDVVEVYDALISGDCHCEDIIDPKGIPCDNCQTRTAALKKLLGE